jgi:hypothetical protein
MTAPNFPLNNPAGQNRRAMRTYLVDWISGQQIRGLAYLYGDDAATMRFDDFPGGSPDFACLGKVLTFDAAEDRSAKTGPVDAGGKMIHYTTTIQLVHRSQPDSNQNSTAGRDDYDRIIDAVKDSLRGVGRDLGRPDNVIQVGEYPATRNIWDRSDKPIVMDGGTVQRSGLIGFILTQYLRPNT